MSELQESVEEGVATAPGSVRDVAAAGQATLGLSLAEARKARGLSIMDVAQAIKFSPRQIEAIEHDEFDKLPGATIVRGFIRSYAKLLRLDPTMLLAMFDKQVPPVVATMEVLTDTGAALPQTGEHSGQAFRPIALAGLLVAVLGAAGAYFVWSSGTGLLGVSNATAPVARVSVAPAVEERTAPAAVPETAAASAFSTPDAGSQPVLDTQAPGGRQTGDSVDPDMHQLIFVFSDKSWVEVKDATQRIIFAQNNLPGTRQVVSGKPPFSVVIGNASHVQLLYEERQIDLQPYTKVDVARFNLE